MSECYYIWDFYYIIPCYYIMWLTKVSLWEHECSQAMVQASDKLTSTEATEGQNAWSSLDLDTLYDLGLIDMTGRVDVEIQT